MASFSLEERDRRWAVVRAHMAAAGLDVVVAADAANSRYLTQVPAAGPTILGLDGAPTVFVDDPSAVLRGQSWTDDVRPTGSRWSIPVVERLRELKADGCIIGITGLDGAIGAPDGNLNYNSFIMLREWLSHTRWVGAGALLREARDVKSAEEIDRLKVATQTAEDAIRATWGTVPGARSEPELRARGLAQLALANSEPPYDVKIAFDDASTLIEIGGRVDGYLSPLVQPFATSEADSEAGAAWEQTVAAWGAIWGRLKPGRPLAELSTLLTTRRVRVRTRISGIGLGDDLPSVADGSVQEASIEGPMLRTGEAFVLRIDTAWTTSGGEHRLSWADAIAITSAGPERLGTRPIQLNL